MGDQEAGGDEGEGVPRSQSASSVREGGGGEGEAGPSEVVADGCTQTPLGGEGVCRHGNAPGNLSQTAGRAGSQMTPQRVSLEGLRGVYLGAPCHHHEEEEGEAAGRGPGWFRYEEQVQCLVAHQLLVHLMVLQGKERILQ